MGRNPLSGGIRTSEVKWILDGRLISKEMDSEINMGPMGKKPFKDFGILGHDNVRNVYTMSWADSMGTQIHFAKGRQHLDSGVMTLYGEMGEPGLKVYGRLVKHVTPVMNDDKHIFEMYDLHAGDDYKVMEITYTRAK